MHFKGGTTLQNTLVTPNDKNNIKQEWSNILVQMQQVGMQW